MVHHCIINLAQDTIDRPFWSLYKQLVIRTLPLNTKYTSVDAFEKGIKL